MSLNHSYEKINAHSRFNGFSVMLQVKINNVLITKPDHDLMSFMNEYGFKFVKRDKWFRLYTIFTKNRYKNLKDGVKATNYELILPSVEYVREVVKYINDDDLERFVNTPNVYGNIMFEGRELTRNEAHQLLLTM